jgi:ABC-type multidrug transport system ATPase subunit
MEYIIVDNLYKSFGVVKALDNINLTVPEGSLFGLIGPDGAGKTTLFRIITTLMLPGSGHVRVKDLDVVKDFRKIRTFTGYMAGRFSLYQDLTVRENLAFYATIFGTSIKENYHLIKDVYRFLEPFEDRPAGKLSGGMKQKLALSCALIHNPEFLVLDEPTTGVDAVSRKEFWDLLKELKKNGMTILVSTSYMDEASLCDEVALINKGILMHRGKPGKILDAYNKPLYAVRSGNMHKLLTDLRSFAETQSVYLFGQNVHLTLRDREENTIRAVAEHLTRLGHDHIKLAAIQPEIEDCFIAAIEQSNLEAIQIGIRK